MNTAHAWAGAALVICLIALSFIDARIKYGTWGRAWCRIVHRHTSGWRQSMDAYGTSRRCNSCKRGWHVTR